MAKVKRKASLGGTKDQGKASPNEQPQKYDETFKKWITQQVDEILPILVTGVKIEAGIQATQELLILYEAPSMRVTVMVCWVIHQPLQRRSS